MITINETIIEKYKDELNDLVFDNFNSKIALTIGNYIIDIAKKNGYAITIDISKFNHQLFHFSFDGTTPDKDLWIIRKRNVVHHFFTSSIYIAKKLEKDGTNLFDKYGLPVDEYSATGGSVPIIVRNTGIIGSITVAGLKPEEDHNLVIYAIKKFLKSKGDELDGFNF
ncbi:heme-degrading domain-containing protein [Paramaledivibacter caminithermalis]|jgi:uncharacterized protein (UPF0303 family)|uniref:Uncharacterized protein, UPF0303 family n=1 Tax=Paramaledivibacter caminithermalis (strain DSM 15212 / CIP 107654 / DViRD3) TaxID=1121301 RepID=A0A1M6K973_PARC5|nr:heme-degrading domain-containing protein [Paramaledivibacter caminithermalis]SHJ55454.1 Uncharacterized protein, UPF0303 family [Paramaledivibacter caminithermalis DSM 15212]